MTKRRRPLLGGAKREQEEQERLEEERAWRRTIGNDGQNRSAQKQQDNVPGHRKSDGAQPQPLGQNTYEVSLSSEADLAWEPVRGQAEPLDAHALKSADEDALYDVESAPRQNLLQEIPWTLEPESESSGPTEHSEGHLPASGATGEYRLSAVTGEGVEGGQEARDRHAHYQLQAAAQWNARNQQLVRWGWLLLAVVLVLAILRVV